MADPTIRYTNRLNKRMPDAGYNNWSDERDICDEIDDVVMGALLTSNRVISGLEVTAGVGLNVDYAAGVAELAGASYTITAGSLAMSGAAPDIANWIYINAAGVVVVAATPPAGSYVPLSLTDCNETTVVRIADLRPFAGALDGHLSNEANPHNVTASQVNLGNVSNYGISDSYSLNSSTSYASSKAVYDAIRNHDSEHDDRFLQLGGGTVSGFSTFSNGLNVQAGTYQYKGSTVISDAGGRITFVGGTGYAAMSGSISCRMTFGSYNIEASGAAYYCGTDNAVSLGHASFRWTAVYAVNGTIQTSDERRKDIFDIGDVSWLYNLTPVAYRWKNGKMGLRYGFSAQDTYSKMPIADCDLIQKPEDEDKQDWGMAQDQLIAPMLKLIQEQSEQIKALSERVESLEMVGG